MRKLKITCGRKVFEAELLETKTAQLLLNELPITANTNIWGEEIFFPVSFTAETESNATEEVEEGTLAYWPPGKTFCIFFGPTPVSTSQKPRAYSPVNIFGKIHGDLTTLKNISPDEKIKVDLL